MAVIAMDLGGTKLAGALFSTTGKLLHKRVVALQGRQGRAVGQLIQQQARELLERARAQRQPVSALGVCVPGISSAKTGRVWAPNIPGWEHYPLQRELEAALAEQAVAQQSIRVVVDSDRACYILGESWQGRAKGCRDAIFLAVGTGIGAGILSDGRIVRGAHDIAGAIGWMALERPFRPEYVSCGCFEHHASGEGLAKVAKELLSRKGSPRPKGPLSRVELKALTAHDVFAAYAKGDPIAKEVLAQAVEFWGMAVANLVSLFNPQKIIFGGGVFGPAKQFVAAIEAEARKWAQPVSMGKVKLLVSKLGSDAGLIGAGYLALQSERSD